MTPSRTPRLLLAMVLVAGFALVAGALAGPAQAAPLKKVRPFTSSQTNLPQGVLQLSWGSVRGARKYQVRWARNAKFRNAERRVTAATRLRLRGLAVGKRHWITVRAVRGKQRGPWSRTIVTVARPQRPRAFPAGSVTSTPVAGGVAMTWGRSVNATRYRIKAGPYGGATSIDGPWLPATARSGTARGAEADLTTVRFGNPLVTNVEAGNAFAPARRRLAPQWHTTLPGAPRPAANGVAVTAGTYNVLCDGCAGARPWRVRGAEVADRIEAAGLDLAVLQEVQGDTGSGQLFTRFADTVAQHAGGDWALNSEQRYGGGAGVQGSRILYDTSTLRQVDTGTLAVPDRRRAGVSHVPWSLFRTTGEDPVEFLAMSVHLGHNQGINHARSLRTLGDDMTVLDQRIEALRARLASRPAAGGRAPAVILGGDLFSGQSSERRRVVGPVRSLVRAGWWDSRQTQRVTAGAAYSSTNHLAAQKPHSSGYGYRVDYLFSKGIGTRTRVHGVRPERTNTPPSDHNLVWSTFVLPRR